MKNVVFFASSRLCGNLIFCRQDAKALRGKSGSALLIVILLMALFSSLSALLVKQVFNNQSAAQAIYQKEQAFYLAEAGLEYAKFLLAKNPGWYTDLPHAPAADANWLIKSAAGQAMPLATGQCKAIRERDSQVIYSVGFSGQGVVVLKRDLGKEFNQWEII